MNDNLKNILLITPGFPADENDTTCIPALQDFIKGLNRFEPNLSITIISLHYPAKTAVYSWFGNEVHTIGANNCRFPKRFIYWKKLQRTIMSLHHQKYFDLIHTFWFDEVTFVSSKTARKLNLPLFCTFMGQDALGNNPYANRIEVETSRLVALSQFHHKKIDKHLGLNVATIIPWGVDSISFPEKEVKKEIDIVNVGAFNITKNQKESIAIIARVKKELPSIKCVFLGDGAELESMKSLVASLGLQNNITFKGKLSRKETLQTIEKSKLLLHSSSYESFGMIFAESITAKTMIVSKAVGMAEKLPFWGIYETPYDATSLIISLLEAPVYPNDSDVLAHSIKSTVDAYVSFWSIKKDRT